MKLELLKTKHTNDAVEILEQLLTAAKEGKVNELVCCARNAADLHYSIFYTGCNDIYCLMGNLEAMKLRMYQRMNK